MLDQYCERAAPGLLGEPVNLLSNAAFLAAALGSWRYRSPTGVLDALTIALMAATGVGSALFHAMATPAARLADAIPILALEGLLLWGYLRRGAGWRHGPALSAVATLATLSILGSGLPHVLNGSLAYLPATAALWLLGAVRRSAGVRENTVLLWAAGLFSLALFLRTIDVAVCPFFPWGTHALWHLASAGVAYLVYRTMGHVPGRGPPVGGRSPGLAGGPH